MGRSARAFYPGRRANPGGSGRPQDPEAAAGGGVASTADRPRRTLGEAALFALLTLLPWGITGCGEGLPPLKEEEAARVVEVAEPVAAALTRSLLGRLVAALEEGGPAQAAEFCSREALRLTAQVQDSVGGGLVLKRTSFRYRNPANAPDPAEEEALRYFEEGIRRGAGARPAHYVQRFSEDEFRYYKPLFVAELCTGCHGHPETFLPELRQVLADRYPGDLATGYEVGQLRGVLRVSVPAARIKP